MRIGRRAEELGDEVFLRQLILDTIADDLGAHSWPEPMRSQILDLQYRGRRRAHRALFPQSESAIIQAFGNDAGWVATASLPHQLRIVDFIVTPQYRSRGISTAVLRDLISAAAQAGQSVQLQVNVTNAGAIRLYDRLGFRRIGGDQIQHVMEKALFATPL